MPAIHIIKKDQGLPSITQTKPGSGIYRSGFWVLAKTTAEALKGGKIYFHERQSDPSFHGGIIMEAEKLEEGEQAGRVVFTFKFDPACRGITTSREGWSQEMKIILHDKSQ